jgi:hypothetical protein
MKLKPVDPDSRQSEQKDLRCRARRSEWRADGCQVSHKITTLQNQNSSLKNKTRDTNFSRNRPTFIKARSQIEGAACNKTIQLRLKCGTEHYLVMKEHRIDTIRLVRNSESHVATAYMGIVGNINHGYGLCIWYFVYFKHSQTQKRLYLSCRGSWEI